MDPRLPNLVGDGVVEKNPGRVAHDNALGLLVDGVATGEIAKRGGFGEERFDARIAEVVVVIGAPLLTREQDVEEVLGVGKVRLPSGEEERDGPGWRIASRNGAKATALSAR